VARSAANPYDPGAYIQRQLDEQRRSVQRIAGTERKDDLCVCGHRRDWHPPREAERARLRQWHCLGDDCGCRGFLDKRLSNGAVKA
jgi:hypothetical protein